MADKGKSKDAGGGPGTSTAGQVKSTMTPVFGKRTTSKRSAPKRGGRAR